MLLSFLGSFLIHVGTVICAVSGHHRWRERGYLLIPFALGVEPVLFGIVSAVQMRYFTRSPEWVLFFSMLLTIMLLIFLIRLVEKSVPLDLFRERGPRQLAWIFAISILAVIDLFLIFGRQGWEFSGPHLLGIRETYFRPPMNNDLERHTVLVNALLHGNNPFSPSLKLIYQLVWHYAVAPLVGSFDVITRYHLVAGNVIFTGWQFFFLAFWGLTWIFPEFIKKKGLAICLFLFLSVHSDIAHMIAGLSFYGRVGIEADWSYFPAYFRNFSPKLIALTAPQHALFFSLAFTWLVLLHSNLKSGIRLLAPLSVCTALLFMTSPVLAVFLGVPMFFSTLILFRPSFDLVKRLGAVLFISMVTVILLHPILFGFWFHETFLRPGNEVWVFFIRDPEFWIQAIFSPVTMGGSLGLGAILFFRRRTETVSRFVWLSLGFGFTVWAVVATGIEVRRHLGLISGVWFSVALAASIHSVKRWSRPLTLTAFFVFFTGVVGHGYFLYSYLRKPSYLQSDFAWLDYFTVAKAVAKKQPGLSVVSAVNPWGIGLEKPPMMEFATSFSLPNHATVHVKADRKHLNFFEAVGLKGQVLPYALSVGYEAMTWGPVEERVWGKATLNRFADSADKILAHGEVSVYRVKDKLRSRFPAKMTLASRLIYAGLLLEGRWYQEAISEYTRYLLDRPNDGHAALRLARAWISLGEWQRGEVVLKAMLKLNPDNIDGWLDLALVQFETNQQIEAAVSYSMVLKLDPVHRKALNNLAVIRMKQGDLKNAEIYLNKLKQMEALNGMAKLNLGRLHVQSKRNVSGLGLMRESAHDKDAQVRFEANIEMGDFYLRQNNFSESLQWYEKARQLRPGAAIVDVKTGFVHGKMGQYDEATRSFKTALKKEPDNRLAADAIQMGTSLFF